MSRKPGVNWFTVRDASLLPILNPWGIRTAGASCHGVRSNPPGNRLATEKVNRDQLLPESAHGDATQAIFHERVRNFFNTRKRGERLARGQGRRYPAGEQSDRNLLHREWWSPMVPSSGYRTLVSRSARTRSPLIRRLTDAWTVW